MGGYRPGHSAVLIRCPQCSSSNIEYPQMTRKLRRWLVGLLCAAKIIPKEFYCQDCFYLSNSEEPTIGRPASFFPGGESSTEAS
jgi:hypothetical protein